MATDRPPPLVVPIRGNPVEKPQPLPEHSEGGKKRKRRSRRTDRHSWDSSSELVRRSRRGEKGQMGWMMVAGASLFALAVVGVWVILNRGGKNEVNPSNGTVAATPAPKDAQKHEKTDEEFIEQAEPIARRFLEAKRVEEMLPLVRNPKVCEARMRAFYGDKVIAAPGLSVFNVQSEVLRLNGAYLVKVRTGDFDESPMAFFESSDGLRIDWESWVGWSAIGWEKFKAERPVTPEVFRVTLSSLDYYNAGFSDDANWQSYRLVSPDGNYALYGYAERGSDLNFKLKPPDEAIERRVMLSLRFPENAVTDNQVVIDRFVADGWVLESDENP